MNWTRQVRTWHKWISVVIGLQLLAWTLSGLIFTLDPIADVRGDTFIASDPPPGPAPLDELATMSDARATAGLDQLAGARLSWMRGRWVWALYTTPGGTPQLVDARRNTRLGLLDADEASAIARRRFENSDEVLDVERVSEAEGEYRGKAVPAWRVSFGDDDATNVYVNAHTGAIAAVRSDTWRRFDFFWMLHIMAYDDREGFNEPHLTAAAVLGVSAALTGVWLAVLVLWPRRRGA
ncbi:MAG: PepSY domain-containing protein [Planctomycetota bacterium]|jgi:hypothetical protein